MSIFLSLSCLVFLLNISISSSDVPLGFFIQAADRTVDLNDLGVNLTSTFDSLLSPSGIVNQFSLSVVIQLIYIVGYVIAGRILKISSH